MSENQNDELDARLLEQMRVDFLEESRELLEQLDINLTRLEQAPRDQDLIAEIFRLVHTLKGSSSFVGLDRITTLAHKMEDVFSEIRKGRLQAEISLIDLMFEVMRTLTVLRDKAAARDTADVDIGPVLQKLALFQNPEGESFSSRMPEAYGEETRSPKSGGYESQAPPASAEAGTLRVATGQLDEMMNRIAELITSRNRLIQCADELKNENLTDISNAIDRLTAQLHKSVMGLRMVPMEKLFIRFPGVVRNLAREKNKQVELILEGGETELDKTVIEKIYDPLVHLLRNAIDHGIEDAATRRQCGKLPTGCIRLCARREQNNVLIEIEDDGRGIDPRVIKAAAIEKGLLAPLENADVSDEQAVRLIFQPGISSAEKITDISGRGVGMDIVRQNIHKLRGMIDIKTAGGKGTMFRIQLPLTLAILRALLVRVNGLPYALPLNMVAETLLISPDDIRTMEKQEVIFIRGRACPLKHFMSVLAQRSSGGTKDGSCQLASQTEKIPVVVVGLAEKRLALCVDELLGKQELVMKSLGNYVGRVPGIEGASILSDGSVTLIADIETVLGPARFYNNRR